MGNLKLIFALFSWFIGGISISQTTYPISGMVTDEDKQGLDLAIVSLINQSDSTIVKSTFTDIDGTFIMKAIPEGSYILRVKQMGFVNYSQLLEVSQAVELNLVLVSNPNVLSQVTVDGSTPLVIREIDRIVINPEALPSSTGANALELLEQAPGVNVDQNGQISLKGRSGVAIYINDKPSYLSGSDLQNYLRSLPAGSIKSIEVIDNPPARYEAAGNSGIININIKRSTLSGFFGNASASYRRSRYNGSNNSVNLNYNRNKISLHANLNAGFWESFQDLNINRYYLDENGTLQSAFEQNSFNNNAGHYLDGRLGLDFYPTDKTSFGVTYKKSSSPGERSVYNTSFVSDSEGTLIQRVVADNMSMTGFDNDLVSLYLSHKLDTTGSQLSFDADYVRYISTNDQLFKNTQYNPEGFMTYKDQINGEIPSEINIYAIKTDYSKPFKDGANFEAGLKTAYTTTDNEAIYSTTVDEVTTPDYGLSNRFLYNEWINAAYINYNRSIGKVTVQAGLRGEATYLEGNQLGNLIIPDTSFTRNYASLFPTFYASRKLDSAGVHLLNFSYGRRIERPYFQDLNPFISPLDKFTFYTGNPNLLPTYSHNLSLTHTYNNSISTTLSYSLIVDGINETLEIQDEIYYSRPGNIATSQFLTLSLNAGIPVAKWYMINAYAEVSAVRFESQLYTEELDSRGINGYAQIINNFSLKKGWKVTFGGQFSSDQVYSQLLIKGYATLNCSVQKEVLKGKGNLRLYFSDIFYSRRGDGVINNLSQTDANWNSKFDSRSVSIAFSIRFGKSKLNRRQYEGSGSESEQRRVKS